MPHITLSVAAGARSVDTGRLDFSPIEPFAVQGVFGGFCRRGFPVTSPLSEEEARARADALACAQGALGLLPGADPDHLEQAARLWQALALQQPAEERYARLRDTCLRALERRWGER